MCAKDQTLRMNAQGLSRIGINNTVALLCVLFVNSAIYNQSHATVAFGQAWGKIDLPVNARVGAIDLSDRLEIGLSAMQLDNIGWKGNYNAVQIRFMNTVVKAFVYNAYGVKSLQGGNVRISSALSDTLGCNVREHISIESLAIIEDSETDGSNLEHFIPLDWKWLWTAIGVPFIGWWLYLRRRQFKWTNR